MQTNIDVCIFNKYFVISFISLFFKIYSQTFISEQYLKSQPLPLRLKSE